MSLSKRLINPSDAGGGFSPDDGKYVYITDSSEVIKKSVDNGVTFSSALYTPFGYYQDTAVSGTGEIVYAVRDGSTIVKSTDFGVNWSAQSSATPDWRFIDCSDTGQYAIAASRARLYWTNDYGANWLYKVNVLYLVGGVAVSGNGQYAILCSENIKPYITSNFGGNWSSLSSYPYSSAQDVAISYSGDYIAITNGYNVSISTDFGSTWNTVTVGGGFGYIARIDMSNSGQYIYTGELNGQTWRSDNFGASFSNTGRNYDNVAVSGSGNNVIATKNGAVYSNDFGLTFATSTGVGNTTTNVETNKLYTP